MIVRRTSPVDETSLGQAIADLEKIGNLYSLNEDFFDGLRTKVRFNDRPNYLRTLSKLDNLNLYAKLDQLQKCKALWGTSSASLTDAYHALALPLLQTPHRRHVERRPTLRLQALRRFRNSRGGRLQRSPWNWSNSTPTGFLRTGRRLACLGLLHVRRSTGRRGAGSPQTVTQQRGCQAFINCYRRRVERWRLPRSDAVEIPAGLVWRMLGSPHAAGRWQAAHSVRRFAKFGRWNIVDALVGKLDREDAVPFQAPELRFYYMHARLWLLMALARIALDHPKAIAKYKDVLVDVIRDRYGPHVLMRHFAKCALIACMDAKEIELSAEMEQLVRNIDRSPNPRLRKIIKNGNDFYRDRPKAVPKPKSDFGLDYDFHKYDVQHLSDVFGRPGWEVTDCLSEIVRRIDPKVTSMWDAGGREISRRTRFGMTSSFHTYGQQLGWHALQLAAGEFLCKYPVTDHWFYNEPWDGWLSRYLLTRSDGLWLADGIDQVPLDVADILLEKGDEELEITGDKTKLLRLAGLHSGVSDQITVSGSWDSTDHVRVRISSVLVAPRNAAPVAKELIDEEPILVWLPEYSEDDEGADYLRNEKPDCMAWVVSPSGEGKLDKGDPLALVLAARRPRIAETFSSPLGICANDPFRRVWMNPRGSVLGRSQAWGRDVKRTEESSVSGIRLVCSRRLLKSVLMRSNSELLILVQLQRYEEGYRSHSEGKYTHTIAVIRVKKTLHVKYYRGRVNHFYKPKH